MPMAHAEHLLVLNSISGQEALSAMLALALKLAQKFLCHLERHWLHDIRRCPEEIAASS